MKARHRPLSWILALIFAGALPLSAQTGWSVRSDGNDAQDDFLYSIDLATGEATPIGPTGFEDVESLTFDLGCDTLYGVDDTTDRLLTCDRETGDCNQVGNLGVDITDTGLAFIDQIRLFMSTDAPKSPTNFYQVNRFTGRATRIGNQGQEVTGLAYGPGGLFGLGGDARENLVRIDIETGAATPIGPLGTIQPSDGGLDFDIDGVLWGVEDRGGRNPSRIFTVDPTTGAATVVATVHLANGTELVGFEGLAIDEGICAALPPLTDPLGIPTLGEWGLLALTALLSLAGVALLRRKRAV